jgi:hypothetical protein
MSVSTFFLIKDNLSRSQIKAEITKVIKKKGLDQMEEFFKSKDVALWGESKSQNFLLDNLYLTIYHDSTMLGYGKIKNQIKRWYSPSQISLQHNIKKCRELLCRWAVDHLFPPGDSKEWDKTAVVCRFKDDFKGANLWMDSSDFPKEGIRKYSRKGRDWSYKLNRPGRRYMVICDAKRRIRFKFGGYSCKTYDGDFLEAKKEFLELVLKDGVILADNHFSLGRKLFQNVKFLVNYKEKKDNSFDNSTEEVINLTKKQKEFNKKHRHARARVESPFADLKNKFKCFTKPFRDGDEQMDFAVTYAMGFHNINIK